MSKDLSIDIQETQPQAKDRYVPATCLLRNQPLVHKGPELQHCKSFVILVLNDKPGKAIALHDYIYNVRFT